MGMEAELLAIGKFSKDIVDILSYPYDFYEEVPEGSDICTCVACMPTKDTSIALAKSFGIEPWEFEKHIFIPDKVDWELLQGIDDCTANEDLCKTVRKLIEKNFLFIYRPNG
jgi:hypothetical protein